MPTITLRPRSGNNASNRQKRDRARRFDPRTYPADREFMREFTREAEADTTENPVYKAIAEYDGKHYPDLLD